MELLDKRLGGNLSCARLQLVRELQKAYLRLLQLLVQSAKRNFFICSEQPKSEQTVGNLLTFEAFFK